MSIHTPPADANDPDEDGQNKLSGTERPSDARAFATNAALNTLARLLGRQAARAFMANPVTPSDASKSRHTDAFEGNPYER